MNFEIFKNLKPSLKYKKAHLNVVDSMQPINFGDIERQYPYRECEFYAFDVYLAAHLKEELAVVELSKVNSGL